MKRFFIPHTKVSERDFALLAAGQAAAVLAVWCVSPFMFLPKPGQIAAAFADLWGRGLATELLTSFTLNLQAVMISTIIALALGYLSTIAFFRPAVLLIGKFRFLSMMGVVFFLTLMTANGHQLKLSILTIAIVPFMVVGLVDVIHSVERDQFDLCRVLRKGPWSTVYEVVVLGQADKAFDVIRQNIAMGWLTLSFAEAMSRSEGGIGAMLATESKYLHLPEIFAIQIVVLLLGLGQDYAVGWIKNVVCPYALLTVERA